MRFCPKCGKKVKEGFCGECRPPAEIKAKGINISVCGACSRYFYKNKWMEGDLKEGVGKSAKSAIKDKDVKAEPILPAMNTAPGNKTNLEVKITKGSDIFFVPATVLFTYCDVCSKKQGRYYEGTLQLRNPNENVISFIDSYVKNNNFFISKKAKVGDGMDLDISDQRKLQGLGQQLKKHFGGTLKVSIRQFTQNRQTSKQVYRVNVLYEAPGYKKGDVLKIDNDLYLLTNIKKSISAIDLKSNKKATLSLKEKGYSLLPKTETAVLKTYPSVEVLDPETFQSVPVENRKEVKIGQKVDIVSDNGRIYLV